MAGDWIKMRTALADDPAVICMADRLGMEEFAVVGRLHHLWSWADNQSRDGHAVGVTGKWLDRYVQRDGFAAAMVAVGWLAETNQGLAFPNFERHNGETAKARGLANNRQQKRRSVVTPEKEQMSRADRDGGVTREEKRREESKSKEHPLPLKGEAADAAGNQGEPAPKPVRKKRDPGFDPMTAKPDNVTADIWAQWVQHRKEIRKPLTPTSCSQQAAQLATHPNPDAVIATSIASGWRGLFPDQVGQAAKTSAHVGLDQIDHAAGLERLPNGRYRIARAKP